MSSGLGDLKQLLQGHKNEICLLSLLALFSNPVDVDLLMYILAIACTIRAASYVKQGNILKKV